MPRVPVLRQWRPRSVTQALGDMVVTATEALLAPQEPPRPWTWKWPRAARYVPQAWRPWVALSPFSTVLSLDRGDIPTTGSEPLRYLLPLLLRPRDAPQLLGERRRFFSKGPKNDVESGHQAHRSVLSEHHG